ncbi:MAG: NADH-quinone oxidoreductase subunit NuoF [Elusimicrobiales bacterium]|jgi:NADH-quinone oxidoreductase subunit F|nr:NADH-quinone oxidoreductase subunit NuoF [Elusimicrobiales bacterium]
MKIILEKELFDIKTYITNGGYNAIKKALTMTPQSVIDEVKKSNLRGRGGAGFPTGLKWSFIPKDKSQKYVVCNSDESEPGTFKDREIIHKNPHSIIEGMIIAGYAIGATKGYIYIRGEFVREARIIEKTIYEAKESGYLGKNILNSGFDFDITVVRGAGAYICGEETALLESIEGKQGKPRIKPPFPATKGLFSSPTVINNVETLAAVPYIMIMGGEKYSRIGKEKSSGTKLFSVSGPVNKPGVYEIELGLSFKDFLENYLMGMKDGVKLKAVIVGGSSVPVITADEAMKVNLDYESLSQAGTMLGSGGMIIIGDDQCMVEALYILARFYHHESCGQCTPCREGTGWIYKLLSEILSGKCKEKDIDLLYGIAENMMGRTICPLADALSMPVMSFVKKFRNEFDKHIEGSCEICQR